MAMEYLIRASRCLQLGDSQVWRAIMIQQLEAQWPTGEARQRAQLAYQSPNIWQLLHKP